MRSSTEADSPWPRRIFRPWLVASSAGLLMGVSLLALFPEPQAEPYGYTEAAPRAAVFDPRGETTLSQDPFAPAPSLAAPPDAPTAMPVAAAPTDASGAPETGAP